MENLEPTLPSMEPIETTLSIPVNRTTCILFYLSKTLNIDISYLYFLYKKFGDDMFYFFFMLAGKKMTLPKDEKLATYIKNADIIYDKITKHPDKPITKVKDLEIYQSLINSINDSNFEIEF
jgi:hypothetical protein